MRFISAVRVAASIISVSVIAACGGGGGDGPSYPEEGNIVVVSGTSSVPAGTYRYDQAADSGAETDVAADGRTIEFAYAYFDQFDVQIAFVQNDPQKYLVLVESLADEYYCRSPKLSNAEFGVLLGGTADPLPECSPGLVIDGPAHRARASNVTVKSVSDPAVSITLSANVKWTL